jgi:hypothetical protein
VNENKKEVNIMFELVQSSDFVKWLSLMERERPAMFARASAEELVDMYGGKMTSHQLTSW